MISEENQNDVVWSSFPLLSLSSVFSHDLILNNCDLVVFNEYMFALPCSTFNNLDDSNPSDCLDEILLNFNYPQLQDNFQDANVQVNVVMAGDNNPNDDLSEGNLGDNDLVKEEEHPINFDEALEFQDLRKRSRNQFDSDDEMNNGSCYVNGSII